MRVLPACARLAWLSSMAAQEITAEADAAGLDGSRRNGADACVRFLNGRHEYLRYDQALAAGWPIATGVIEGACRHLPDRLDIGRARWGLSGVHPGAWASRPENGNVGCQLQCQTRAASVRHTASATGDAMGDDRQGTSCERIRGTAWYARVCFMTKVPPGFSARSARRSGRPGASLASAPRT